ncbi:TetR/AcrR family transcriptional regulator [Streptomyces sp. NBC_01808]|uniref:TetR/AcrR family transcriptional regulator n=1 Tax=Streptomyces sp. NBC_01808 TaxID=2975947 RepID=UPI002DDC407E|nr:helix-turn-helix domain-containing protein [Streptomyces sp. NBC_01808]WSA37107.1 TetR/AcrR family transcriptional regulator [Streptomyces sp. NBC_01808]
MAATQTAVQPRLTPAARKILDAAETLFYNRGITAVGVDLIARRAGVTKKTIYDRYGSKDALVAAYLRRRDERWRTWLPAEVERTAAGGTACDRILATFDALGTWMGGQSPRGCSFVNAAAELTDPGHAGRQVIADQKHWLRGYLRELCERAGAEDPGLLADELLLIHEGATVLYGLSAVPEPVTVSRRLAEAALLRAGCTA